MRKRITSIGAVVGAATLTGMVMAPAFAATTVAQADATALVLSIAGNPADSGTVTATHDGSQETKTGTTQPPIDVLNNQNLLDIGTLAQDATAGVDDGNGVSAACSGVAGDGASVATVGDSSCITPGANVGVNIANLDLSQVVVIDEQSALGALGEVLNGPLADLLGPVTSQLSTALDETPLSTLAIGGTIGAVESRCIASPGSASGNAIITDASLSVTLPGQAPITLVELPVNPPPNTKVLTNLDVVLNAVLDGVEAQLTQGLDGALDPLNQLTAAVRENIVNTVIAQIAPQLAPLEENLLDITLNKQSRPAQGAIEVTAIDLGVLPAAASALGAPLVSAQIANVSCGPNGRVAAPRPPKELPEVPTVIDSGTPRDGGVETGDVLVGGALVLAALGGLIGYRRFANNV